MIDERTVWEEIWPVVERLVRATLVGDNDVVKPLLTPNSPAAEMYDLFGLTVFDILLKTVLNRDNLGLARAIEAENGKQVHIECAWLDPGGSGRSYLAGDVVSVQLRRYRRSWQVVDLNPAGSEAPMTEARALNILQTSAAANESEDAAAEPWILPVALYAGALQLPIRAEAMADPVEELFLPGMQSRGFGLTSIGGGRRLWRAFLDNEQPDLSNAGAWAAAVEFVMTEQAVRDVSQASVAQNYTVGIGALASRAGQLKQTLGIDGLDERFSPFGLSRVVLQDEAGSQDDGGS
jgi:hypothetical protein